tara:strand:+ start:299 stop:913 length:615 start_codon:yes stop_codon:yes gene_type:complete
VKTIVITGPSGSGKSFLSNKLSKLFDNSILLKTDSYYRDNILIRFLSTFIFDIYDRPLSIKKNELEKTIEAIYMRRNQIKCFQYDFIKKQSSHSIKNISNKGKNQILILEGIFSHRLDLNYSNTVNILCNEDKGLCLKRRLRRDKSNRGRSQGEIIKRFNRAWNLYYINLKPYVNHNEVINLNTSNKINYKNLIYKINNQFSNN